MMTKRCKMKTTVLKIGEVTLMTMELINSMMMMTLVGRFVELLSVLLGLLLTLDLISQRPSLWSTPCSSLTDSRRELMMWSVIYSNYSNLFFKALSKTMLTLWSSIWNTRFHLKRLKVPLVLFLALQAASLINSSSSTLARISKFVSQLWRPWLL